MATRSTATARPQATATTTAAGALVSIGRLRSQAGHAVRDLLFEAVWGGLVVRPSLGIPWAVLLLDPAPGVVVRIVVTRAVPELRRPVVAGPAQVRRYLACDTVADVVEGLPQRRRRPIRLGRRREVHDGLSDVQLRFRQSDELDGT